MTSKNKKNKLNCSFGLDENHTVIAVFEDNNSDTPIGWSVVEKGVEGDYPVLTVDELLEKYGN